MANSEKNVFIGSLVTHRIFLKLLHILVFGSYSTTIHTTFHASMMQNESESESILIRAIYPIVVCGNLAKSQYVFFGVTFYYIL